MAPEPAVRNGQERGEWTSHFRHSAWPEDPLVRVHRDSNSIKDLQSLLVEFGFMPIGDSTHLRWFLHNDAPDALSLRARSAVTTQNALN